VQYTALSSCYSRHRRLARYIMVIDDDEYVALAPRLLVNPTGTSFFTLLLFSPTLFATHTCTCAWVLRVQAACPLRRW
jgi:hypothetical protein